MTIKGILFDAADVLYRRQESTHDVARRMLQARGYSRVLDGRDVACLEVLLSQASEGRIHPEDYWGEFLKAHGVASPQERAEMIAPIFAQSHQVEALPGAHDVVAALKQRGFVLGIVTDTMYPLAWKMNWLEKVGVAEFIDVVACSTVLGVHKPDPAIYLDALRQANLAVVEAAFVGHDAGEIKGARKVGLKTVAVLYDPQAQADYYAETLADLLNVPIFLAPLAGPYPQCGEGARVGRT